ncbi:DUF4856 domain-containing protein [Cesiribacter sp. SM1]|uniref:DUF4856 domain-containing protein n=1 Tax=Cesiribacter sp. SM1 TaxID=2861196 RepID=UPI001CD6986D|nr:DUF4856 domain-containing protein [Cesiribacter sp. SM1]
MLRRLNHYILFTLTAGLLAVACDEEDLFTSTPAVPQSYNFENVDVSGQQQRILLLDSLIKKAGAADGKTRVTAADLTAIYENSGKLFGTDKNLSSVTSTDTTGTTKAKVTALFKQIETLSGNPAQVVDTYLVTEKGIEPAEILAKGLVGSILYWQATAVYLGEEKMNADNTKVTEGKGTAMQYHWDQAFGYFGVPNDFPATDGMAQDTAYAKNAWFWGRYANQHASQLDVRQDIMDAFISGRAAINRNDLIARNEAIATIREKWDLLAAANVVHSINATIKAKRENNTGAYYHSWSESSAFAQALRYNPASRISGNELTALLGANPAEASFEELEQARALLQEVYGFTDAQMQNL